MQKRRDSARTIHSHYSRHSNHIQHRPDNNLCHIIVIGNIFLCSCASAACIHIAIHRKLQERAIISCLA